MKGYVYILISQKDRKQYIGCTVNIENRLREHNSGYVRSTKHRRPLVLKTFLEYETIEEAAVMEKKFKRSHGALERALRKKLSIHNIEDNVGT